MRGFVDQQQTTRVLRAVIFDFGNVISLPQAGDGIDQMASLLDMPRDKFVPLYFEHRSEYDRGTLDDGGYWRRLFARAGRKFDEELTERLVEIDHGSWAHINNRMVDWIRRLGAAGVKTAILSNMPVSFYQRVLARYSWIGLLNVVVISGKLGLVKPEPEIFHATLSELGTDPDETLFIDDLEPNVTGARRVGLEVIRFSDEETLDRIVSERYRLPRVVEAP
jgi:putative hydrolase of the HAD superfamily